jgi:hypothetical protein
MLGKFRFRTTAFRRRCRRRLRRRCKTSCSHRRRLPPGQSCGQLSPQRKNNLNASAMPRASDRITNTPSSVAHLLDVQCKSTGRSNATSFSARGTTVVGAVWTRQGAQHTTTRSLLTLLRPSWRPPYVRRPHPSPLSAHLLRPHRGTARRAPPRRRL